MGSFNNNKAINWHTESLPRNTKRALDFLREAKWLNRTKWYLAGGTALALYMGHRQSLDLDFFTPDKNFTIGTVIGHFKKGDFITNIAREGTIYGKLLGAKVSFIAYPFFRIRAPLGQYGAVKVLAPRDIAVMKIIAISQRGKKRDFIDLYWYAQHQEPLIEAVRRLPDQYPDIAHNYQHILKSLMYFEDAEKDPLPKLFFDASWDTVKKYFKKEVPELTKKLLGL